MAKTQVERFSVAELREAKIFDQPRHVLVGAIVNAGLQDSDMLSVEEFREKIRLFLTKRF